MAKAARDMAEDFRHYLQRLRRERWQVERVLDETTDPELLETMSLRIIAITAEERRVLRQAKQEVSA